MTGRGTEDPRPAQAGLVVSAITDYADGVSAIDTDYVRPRFDASHLIVHRGRAAFVDTGTSHAVPRLLAALEHKGLAPDAVEYVFITHVHLDHAGGAGTLLSRLPRARAVVHPRAAPHLADPARLIAATRQVYGEDLYAQLYGEIVPIPAERLVVTTDGSRVDLAGRPFVFLHTPGHALHHHVVHDPDAQGVFTGDTFGISYREFDVDGRAFLMPATTPSQFDPDQMHASIDRVLALRPQSAYLTHYGRIGEIERAGEALHAGVDAFVACARRCQASADRVARLREDLFAWLSGALDAHGYAGDVATRRRLLDPDVVLDADGLIAWLDRRP